MQLRELFAERAVERAAFIVIIAFLLFVSLRSQGERASLTGEVTLLEQQSAESLQKLEALQEEMFRTQQDLDDLQQNLEKQAAAPQETPEPVTDEPPAPLEASWNVEGAIRFAEDYNADAIEVLADEIDELESSDEDRSDEIRELEREIRELEQGEPRYELEKVVVSVENPRTTSAELSYALCWVSLDCRIVVSKGVLTAEPGSSAHEVPLDIPTKITIDKRQQVLRFTLLLDGEELLADDHVILAPALTR